MSKITSFLCLLLFLFACSSLPAQEECIAATGFWSDLVEEHPFLCDEINNGGNLLIPSGVTVTVDEKLSLSNKTILIVQGTLFFDGNTARLDLPDGSGLRVEAGGAINTNVRNNSQRIRIGNTNYWTSNAGKIEGPITYGSATLPVELLSFDARLQEETVTLNWATASESNSDFFAIEHSVNGHSFASLGQLQAAGTSSDKQYYQFRHAPQSPGDHYYRLRQVDFDGTASFSAIKVVHLASQALFRFHTSTNFNEIRLQLDPSLPALEGHIRIFDYSGRLLKAQQALLSDAEIRLDISDFESGTYLLQVEYAGRLMAKPFVKMTS